MVRQIEQHQTLVTVIVDGYQGASGASPPIQYPEHYWQLPKADPQPGGNILSRLHTVDIYFWSAGDADSFTAILRKLLRPEQLDLPIATIPQEQAPSPVIQRLENLAIKDPAYHDGQPSNSNSALAASIPQSNALVVKEETPKAKQPEIPTTYQLLAYNPASPPAPEKIAHRDKTPPPPDSGAGTGLAAVAYRDQSHSGFSPTSQPQGWTPYAAYGQSPGPHGYSNPPAGQAHSGSYVPPPPPQPGYIGSSPQSQEHKNPSVSSSTYVPSSNPYIPGAGYTPSPPGYRGSQAPFSPPGKLSFEGPPKDPNAHLYGTGSKPPDSPATEILGNSYVSGQPPLQHLQPQYADYLDSRRQSQQQTPEGGYSNYQYEQPPQHHHHHHHHSSNKHSVHNEWYQPTEAEAHKHKPQRPPGSPAGKLEQRAEKVEKGIGRLLKKVEKKIG